MDELSATGVGWMDGDGSLEVPALVVGSERAAASVWDAPFFALQRAQQRESCLFSASHGAAGGLREGAYECPVEETRKRRRLGGDGPEHWDPMNGHQTTEVPLFSRGGACFASHPECCGVLGLAFKSCFGEERPSGVQALVDGIAEKSYFQVLSVTRLQNVPRHAMHKSFARIYDIPATVRTVYHGTSEENARIIAQLGFRNAASQRARFGKGIYAAASVWEALAYAEPDAEYVQTFLVADLIQGPTRVGHENMADFGKDLEGQQILTTTNPEETIFCAAYEDQLYAHYRVTVRFMVERPLCPLVHNRVGVYHPVIWKRIKERTNATAPAAGVGASTYVAPPRVSKKATELEEHMSFAKDEKVKIVLTLKPFSFCVGHTGFIRKIIKDGHVHFCVEIDDLAVRRKVELINNPCYPWFTDLAWLRCRVSHIKKT